MGKKEFIYSITASIIAAVIIDATGVLNLRGHLANEVSMPAWGIILLIAAPIALSLIWFRKTVTPAHQKLINENTSLKSSLEIKDAVLAEQKNINISLEKILNTSKEENEKITESLTEWEKLGIKKHDPEKPLQQITNKTFGVEIVELDGKEFLNCRFNGSILKFKGTAPIGLNHIHMVDVRWVMDEPASNAFQLLGALYQTGDPDLINLVEATFNNIRGIEGPNLEKRKPEK
ncbi:hypothetical protein P4544_16470 [Halomonas sp. LY9]